MAMYKIIDEVINLYQIIKIDDFRKTPGVTFNILPREIVERTDAFDRVIHERGAVSPGPVGDCQRPWYMHLYQDDNLVILYGAREVDIYTPEHGQIEHFTVTPNEVYKNGILLTSGCSMLVWPKRVFHRIISGAEGSASINLAVHYAGWDIRNNFNIYDLDTATGEFRVIREGFEDQT